MNPAANIKILLSEDNKINQRLFTFTLAQYDLKCDVANNGLEAFEMYKQNAYDLIFMDMHMPVCDGLESTILIRQFEAENKLENKAYIVALSASLVVEHKEEYLDAGMNDYMEKPLKNNLLLAVIEKVNAMKTSPLS